VCRSRFNPDEERHAPEGGGQDRTATSTRRDSAPVLEEVESAGFSSVIALAATPAFSSAAATFCARDFESAAFAAAFPVGSL